MCAAGDLVRRNACYPWDRIRDVIFPYVVLLVDEQLYSYTAKRLLKVYMEYALHYWQSVFQNKYYCMSHHRVDHICTTADVCRTKTCTDEAQSILSMMDKSADPCNNFFRYACGGWIDRYDPIPEGRGSFNQFDEVERITTSLLKGKMKIVC